MSAPGIRLMEWSASWLPVTHVASVGEPRLVGPTLERAAELEQPPHWVCDVARLCRGSQAHVAAAVEPAILSREGVEALVSAPGTCRRCVEEARRLLAETAPEVSGEDPLGTPSMLDMLAAREGGDPR